MADSQFRITMMLCVMLVVMGVLFATVAGQDVQSTLLLSKHGRDAVSRDISGALNPNINLVTAEHNWSDHEYATRARQYCTLRGLSTAVSATEGTRLAHRCQCRLLCMLVAIQLDRRPPHAESRQHCCRLDLICSQMARYVVGHRHPRNYFSDAVAVCWTRLLVRYLLVVAL